MWLSQKQTPAAKSKGEDEVQDADEYGGARALCRGLSQREAAVSISRALPRTFPQCCWVNLCFSVLGLSMEAFLVINCCQ